MKAEWKIYTNIWQIKLQVKNKKKSEIEKILRENYIILSFYLDSFKKDDKIKRRKVDLQFLRCRTGVFRNLTAMENTIKSNGR